MPSTSKRPWVLPTASIAIFIAMYVGYWLVYAASREAHAFWLGLPQKGGGEDKGVEWVGTAGFVFASVFAFMVLRFRAKMHHKLVFLYFLVMGLFYFACAGEEISWGQRIFGWETSARMMELNEQGETNIHNLKDLPIHPKDVVSWWMKLFGIGLPVIFYFALRKREHWLRRCVAPLNTVPLFIFVEVFNKLEDPFVPLAESMFDRAARRLVITQHEEIMEMYWGLCVFIAGVGVYLAWKRAGTTRET